MSNVIKFRANAAGTAKPRAVQKKEVLAALGISSPTLYRLIKAGLFPKPMKIGAKMSRWLESDIDDYLESANTARTINA